MPVDFLSPTGFSCPGCEEDITLEEDGFELEIVTHTLAQVKKRAKGVKQIQIGNMRITQ